MWYRYWYFFSLLYFTKPAGTVQSRIRNFPCGSGRPFSMQMQNTAWSDLRRKRLMSEMLPMVDLRYQLGGLRRNIHSLAWTI